MAFEIDDLDSLDPALVTQMLISTESRLRELHPELDLKRGVFHDTVMYYHSVLEAAIRTNLARYLSGRSLLEIERDPSLADSEVTDSVLSLYRLQRRPGTAGYGRLTIVLSGNTTVTVPSGSVWAANGQEFITTQVYSAKAEPETLANDSDRLIYQLSDGNYAFQIDVVATADGPAGKLTKDAKVIPNSQPFNYLTAYVTEDFEDGTAAQTNDSLLGELQEGMAAKALSNRINMRAALRNITSFANITDMSIVGFGDAEMLRDQHSILPLSYGGRVDWYIRGQPELRRVVLSKSAVLISKEYEHGVWQFSVGRDDAPGFFELRNVRLTGVNAAETAGGFTIVLEQRGLDLTGTGFIPDIETQEEGEYSRFQTAVVQFQDTVTNVTALEVGTTQLYEIEAVCTPLIAEIQTVVSSRDVRNHGADALIKAPIPCFVQINFTVNKKYSDQTPDLEGIKQEVMSAVNAVPFVGRLDASQICDAVHGYLRNSMSITGMDLFGRIRRPNGTDYYLRDSQSLVVKDDPAQMVTAKTVQFFLERENIAVNVENSVPVPV